MGVDALWTRWHAVYCEGQGTIDACDAPDQRQGQAPVPKRVIGWVRRHKVWSVVIGFFALCILSSVVQGCSSGFNADKGSSSASNDGLASTAYKEGYNDAYSPFDPSPG